MCWKATSIDYGACNIIIRSLNDYSFEDIEVTRILPRTGKNNIEVHLFPLQEELPMGLYHVEYSEEDLFGFEDTINLRMPSSANMPCLAK
jgi:hypothetical protein